MMRNRQPIVMFAVLLGGIALGAVLTRQLDVNTQRTQLATDELVDVFTPRQALAQTAAVLPPGSTIADVAAKVTPSVVSVFTEKDMPEGLGSPLYFFFGQPDNMGPRKQQGLGSGVVVSSDGIILTNNHVVEHADTIRVGFVDGSDIEAEIIGTDPKSDLAVIRVKRTGLQAISMADSSKMRVGEVVLAVGNPFGLSHSVTMGIISALGRANMNITDYENFIQTDAAINPGNSGGALVNLRGELLGINTAIASRSGGYQGIGFAIPSDMATNVKNAILKEGRVRRGWLGVSIQNIDDDLAATMGLKARSGVLVGDVMKDSPGAKAGLQRGDVITAVDGVATAEPSKLRNLIASKGANISIRLDILRNNRSKRIDVKLGELPEDAAVATRHGQRESGGQSGSLAGLTVRDLDRGQRARARIADDVKGVLVVDVAANSAAAAVGVRPGDVIIEFNRKPTPNVKAFEKAAKAKQDRVLLLVYRDGNTVFLAFRGDR